MTATPIQATLIVISRVARQLAAERSICWRAWRLPHSTYYVTTKAINALWGEFRNA